MPVKVAEDLLPDADRDTEKPVIGGCPGGKPADAG